VPSASVPGALELQSDNSSPAIPKKTQIKLGPPKTHEIRHNLTYSRGKLEPVPGTRTDEKDLWISGVPINEEVSIWRVRVKANRFVHASTERRHERASDAPQTVGFVKRGFTGDGVGINGLALMMPRELYAMTQVGKTVEKFTASIFPKMNRASRRGPHVRFARREPKQRLPFDRQW